MDNQPSEAAVKLSRQFLAWQHGPLPVTTIDIDTLARAFDAYAAEQAQAARTDALEQACEAVCDHCRRGGFQPEQYEGVWAHYVKNPWNSIYDKWVLCKAAPIRALMSETEVTRG